MIEITTITEVMHYLEGLKAVVFDLDDTLYSEKEYIRSGYQAVARRLPEIDDAEAKLWKAFEDNKAAFDEVLKDEGIYTEELKNKCLGWYRCHQPDIHLYDGVKEMLLQLKSNGIKTGIITDGRPEGQRAKINVLGLEKLVDVIIITDELGGIQYRKPCEKVFLLMKEYLDVEFGEMCYVGDNRKKDFVAGEKLGMRTVWVRNVGGLYQ